MSTIPIRERHAVEAGPEVVEPIEAMAADLRRRHPELVVSTDYEQMRPTRLDDAPTFHLDDLTGIWLGELGHEVRALQERVRFRAGDGDVVASSLPAPTVYETYCRDRLGLGAVEWLEAPAEHDGSLALAAACWRNQETRQALVEAFRSRRLERIHPHLGNFDTWKLAVELSKAAGRPIPVIAPPPWLCAWVNDKRSFSATVERLVGADWLPESHVIQNLEELMARVEPMAATSAALGFKRPDSAGGYGTVVIRADDLLDHSRAVRTDALMERLERIEWRGNGPLVVTRWEAPVVGSPSTQVWIPPREEGPPVVEGLFRQLVLGEQASFRGSVPAELPEPIVREMATESWRLARLYQALGYIGRCSFDLILCGDDLERARPKFVECNGRWGGTSAPMLLMNRVFGDHRAKPYASYEIGVPGLDRLAFADLMERLEPVLYDRRTGVGWVMLFAPSQIGRVGEACYITLGDDLEAAQARAMTEFPALLRQVSEPHED